MKWLGFPLDNRAPTRGTPSAQPPCLGITLTMACQWQPRSCGGLYLDSNRVEQLGVLPGEDRLVREVMDHQNGLPKDQNGLPKDRLTVPCRHGRFRHVRDRHRPSERIKYSQ